ncbi:MAG: MFS transporter [Candidatus Paceibacterota bacterium]
MKVPFISKKQGGILSFNKQIKILLMTNGTILAATAMLGPIYARFVEKIGGSILDTSYAFCTYAFAAAITTLISGRYVDRLKENELVLVCGYIVMGLSFFGYMFVDSIWSLLLVQVLIGFGEAIYAPAFDALYSKHLDGRQAGREWGAWESIYYFMVSFGAITGGFLVVTFGFNAMFIIMGSLCLVSAVYILRLPRKML